MVRRLVVRPWALRESMITVSVVIPTYNRAALVRESINSVLAQSRKDVEILVVDDGSTDDTPRIERDYTERIVYLRQDNRGLNAARNAAIARARGQYIALLDSDDLHLPWTIDLLVAMLDRFPQAGFAYADFLILRGDRPPFGPGLKSWHGADFRWESVLGPGHSAAGLGLQMPDRPDHRDFQVHTGDIYAASLSGPQVLPSASMFRRDCLGDLRFPEFDSLCGDWEFFARLSHSHGAVYADVPAALNRSHEDAVRLTRTDRAIQLKAKFDLIERLWRQDPEFLAAHRESVDARQFDLLLALAQCHLLRDDPVRALTALALAAPLRRGRKKRQWHAVSVAARLPGASAFLRFGHSLRGWIWGGRMRRSVS